MSFFRPIGLQAKIIFFVLLGVAVSFGLLSLLGLEAVNESTSRTLQERLIIARMAANQIDQTLTRGITELENQATPQLIPSASNDIGNARYVLRELKATTTLFTYNVFLLDSSGKVLYTEPRDPTVIGTNIYNLPHVARTLETGEMTVSGVVAAPGTKRPIVSITVPVKDPDGRVIGALGGAFDLTDPTISKAIQGMKVGVTGHTQIVDERGIVIASTDPAFILREWHHPGLVPPPKGSKAFVVSNPATMDGGATQSEVVAYMPLSVAPWGIAVEQRESEAFAPTRELQSRMLIFALVLFMSALFFAWLTTRNVVTPLKQLTAASQRIAAGDLDNAVLKTGSDELGTLAASFNAMIIRLRESREEIQRWNTDLEARVAERTKELSCLVEISKTLASTLDVSNSLQTIVAKIADLFEQADSGSLFLYDPRSDTLVARSSFEPDRGVRHQTRLKVGEGIPGSVFQSGRALLLVAPSHQAEDASEQNTQRTLTKQSDGRSRALQPWSAICVPLAHKNKITGTLALYSYEKTREFNESHLRLLQALADQIAISIENERLLKEAEQARALQEADRLKSEFISTISHELRTPLAGIKGYTTTLLRKDVEWDQDTKTEFLEIIDEESDKLRELIDNLLESSKVEAGVLHINKQPILLARIAQRAVSEVTSRAKKFEFLVEFPPKFPIIEADPRRIEQILHNLLENAVKYSPNGGRIIIRGQVGDDHVMVSVADQGVGIPEEQIDRIFERFHRVEHAQTRHAGGSGLGLSITRALVEAHGGKIWAESAIGSGSTFYFTLPLTRIEAQVDEDGDQGETSRVAQPRSIGESV